MSVLDLLNVFTESENCDLCVCARESESKEGNRLSLINKTRLGSL